MLGIRQMGALPLLIPFAGAATADSIRRSAPHRLHLATESAHAGRPIGTKRLPDPTETKIFVTANARS